MEEKKKHWESLYKAKGPTELSWTQERPSPSLEWILDAVTDRSAAIIDVGGGTSPLVEFLLDAGYSEPAVLDISGAAIEKAKAHLGVRKSLVEWIEADVTTVMLSRKFSLWHDRAVFHFLTNRPDREKYLTTLRASLTTHGKLLLATFSPNGPGQCSGLDVMRFDESTLAIEIGPDFHLIKNLRHTHKSPWGSEQEFQYCLFQKR
jgi:trans-aconitate methyltransferase